MAAKKRAKSGGEGSQRKDSSGTQRQRNSCILNRLFIEPLPRFGFISIVLFIILLDQLTKYLAFRALADRSIVLIANVFSLILIKNTGASFGILKDATVFLILISIVVIGILIFYQRKLSCPARLFAAVMLGGIIGNLIDRIAYGFVIDFLAFSFWPAFNVADIAITVSAITLIYCLVFKK